MILVTVGTQTSGFDRLVALMDQVAAQIEEDVVIQSGCASYVPVHARHFNFGTGQEMLEFMQQARVVVSHAAAGTSMLALKMDKPLVLVPRLKFLGEVFDDHQLQLARALNEAGLAVSVTAPEPASLLAAIEKTAALQRRKTGAGLLVRSLRDLLESWSHESGEERMSAVSRT